METVSKFLSGALGGSMVSGFLLFIFRGQNKKIDELERKKVNISNCEIITANTNEKIVEIKEDLKTIKATQIKQLEAQTESKTILSEIKQHMAQRRRDDS